MLRSIIEHLKLAVVGVGLALVSFATGAADAVATHPATATAEAAADLKWEDLVPKDWDPMKTVREKSAGILTDADPRMVGVMKSLRELWDNAPTRPEVNGTSGRLAGYIVPLEESKGELKEFLLVPYFGACIHSPPPPANQIVHVALAKPVKFKSMDAVWVSGTLRTDRLDSTMGVSGYRMDGLTVEKYKRPATPASGPATAPAPAQ